MIVAIGIGTKVGESMAISPLDAAAEHAEALCDPHHHAEPRWEWDKNRHRKPLPPHQTTVPGLITQLRELATELTAINDSGIRTIPDSTPPGAFDAVSLLAAIEYGTAKRLLDHRIERRETPEANIRAIIGALPQTDSDQQNLIRRELQAWRNQAEVLTGWRTPATTLPAPCPITDCNRHGTLLARADGDLAEAWCTNCGAQWDHETIGVLARHITTYRDAAEATTRDARARAVAERRAGEQRHAAA